MRRPKPLADLVGPLLGPALASQGFTGSDIVASWPEIVGERLAAASRPIKVEWPRRRGGPETIGRPEPATLVVRVTGAFALEIQHSAPLILERINAVYGWRCVGRLVLKQGPVASRPTPRRAAAASEGDRRRVAAAVSGLDAEPLRRALERLGCAMAAAGAEPRPDEAASGIALPFSPRRLSSEAT